MNEWKHLKVEYMRNDFILFGDSNIDWEREHFIDKQQMILIDDFTTENGLKEIIKSHTHRTIVDNKIKTNQIDHSFSDRNDIFAETELCDFSDHDFIYIKNYETAQVKKQKYLKLRSFKTLSKETFLAKLSAVIISGGFLSLFCSSLNESVNNFTKTFCKIQGEFASYIHVKCRKNYCKYLNDELKWKIKQKNKEFCLYIDALKTATGQQSNCILKNDAERPRKIYISIRNEVNSLVRATKREYYG